MTNLRFVYFNCPEIKRVIPSVYPTSNTVMTLLILFLCISTKKVCSEFFRSYDVYDKKGRVMYMLIKVTLFFPFTL